MSENETVKINRVDRIDRVDTVGRSENLFAGVEETSREAKEAMTAEDQEWWQHEVTARMIRLAGYMTAGMPVDAPEVQAELDIHYASICRFWVPNAAAYRRLGQTYLDDPRFRRACDRIAGGPAVYQRDAMAVHADVWLR
ncbi:TipAS antibiotic-recognition domain-containing protein [Streptomyces cyaneofuscatus]|uniref:TipAS antibiotic-recognition domain-containing protein n=1 Tax=Streptomyces cyaneofuscatus TaxID=66883 RepID=UPI00379A3046